MLYVAYGECNRFEIGTSKAWFEDLYDFLKERDLKDLDNVIDTVRDIAHYHERDGSIEGLMLGFVWAKNWRTKIKGPYL